MGSFADSVKNNIQLLQEEVNTKITNFAADTFKDVVRLSPSEWKSSPYATGLLANQWYPSAKEPSSTLTSDKDLLGFNSLDRIEGIRDTKYFLKKDGVLFLTNNVPYAYQAEAIGWKYAEKYAMVATAIDNAKARLR